MQIIQIYTHSPLRNFTYLIGSDDNRFWCVDPFDGEEIAAKLKAMDATLAGIINTHEHDDHTCGNRALLAAMNCKTVAGHPECAEFIPGFSRALNSGDCIEIDAEHQLKVMDCPGHSRGHVCLLLETQACEPVAIFSGDILFNAGVGHCRLAGGGVEKLYKTLSEQFYPLPDSVKVYPGHEYLGNNLQFSLSLDGDNASAKAWLARWQGHDWNTGNLVTTLADERAFNPFFRLDDAAIRIALDLPDAPEKEVFIALRARRDNW